LRFQGYVISAIALYTFLLCVIRREPVVSARLLAYHYYNGYNAKWRKREGDRHIDVSGSANVLGA
jgi:hypothetical protein